MKSHPLYAERSRGGGRGGARGGGGRGRPRSGGERAGKREFDRHDASGRGHETEKRHGGGRGNWGAEGEEAKDLAEKTLGDQPVDSEGEVAAVEEEEKQLTLEEYEALLSEKRSGLNVQRDAAFKADDAQFQGMKTFEKVEEDVGLGLNKNAKTIGANKGGRERGRKERELMVDVGFRVQSNEEQGGGGGRGGRGERGGRGGDRRPRGGGRAGGRSAGGREGRGPRPSGGRGAAINMEDTSAFPSLG
jgi:plasminogen activator inhibitor 1 RNA-binding protein